MQKECTKFGRGLKIEPSIRRKP